MSGDHAKREIVTGNKPASSGRTLSRESEMKKVVYYETDSSSPSMSSSFDSSVAS
jgi:hypothetical protein